MEVVGIVLGSIAALFVIVFGGRGLVDLAQGARERRRSRSQANHEPLDSDGTEDAGAVVAAAVADAPPAPSIAPPAPDPVYRRTFVGRDAELDTLHKAFDEALDDHGSLAMVVGEPGIGKTSLTEQLAGYVAERGGKTLVGHCYEEGSLSLPYLAFVEAVRTHVLALSDDDLRAQLGRGDDDLSRIVPEIRERLQIDLGPPGDPEEERYRLLEAASDFLRRAAAEQPLAVVLEDLHDADRGTLDMLTHLSRNLTGARLLVIGTYRDVEVNRSHPLAIALAELRRVTSFERLPLRGLTQDEVHRMLAAIAGDDVPWRWAEVVHRQTEGNPLFVQEVMRYLVEEGLLAREEGELRRMGDEPLADRIPEGLRDVIGKRLTRLSDACNRVLSVASVVGREFRLDVLERVVDLPEDERIASLKEASGVGVIEERTDLGTGVTFRFTHAFFRQTLYEEIFAPQRLQHHQEVARALEQVHERRLEEHAAEIAEHFSHSTDREGLAKALAFSEMAAQQAMAVHAHSEAVRLLDQALKVHHVLDPDDKSKRCDLLLSLAEALLPTDEPGRAADPVGEELVALAEALGDSERASRACRRALEGLHRSNVEAWRTPEWRAWSERADKHAAAGSIGRVYADIGLGRATANAGDLEGGFALVKRALELARRLEDPEAMFNAAAVVLRHGIATSLAQEVRPIALEFADRPTAGVRARTLAFAYEWIRAHLFFAGERDKGEELVHAIEKLGERSGDSWVVILAMSYVPALLTLDGRLEEAAAAAKPVAAADEFGAPGTRSNYAVARGFRALELLGRLDEVSDLNPGALPLSPMRFPPWLVLTGHPAEALEVIERLKISDVPNTTLVLWAAVALKQQEHARAWALASELSADQPILFGGVSPACGRLIGNAAVLSGDPDKARAYYLRALEATTKIRYRPEIALTRFDLAELLLDNYPDDRAEAIDHLDFAIDEFREMKMQPSLERALARQQSLKN